MRGHRIVLLGAALLAATLAAPVAADEIGVPDNNPTTGAACNVGPFGYAEARHQTLVPASMLGGKPIVIKDLAFASCLTPSPALSFSTLVITFAHTTQASLSTVFAQNLTQDVTVVRNGSVNWTTTYQQWSPIGLTGTFRYNGVDNLVIEVKFIGATGGRVGCYRSNNVQRAYVTGAGTFNAVSAPVSLTALKMQLRFDAIRLSLSGTPRPGGTVALDLLAPGDAGKPYQLGSSLGLGPIPLGTRQIALSPDALLAISVGNLLPSVFVKYGGTLDASGKAQAAIAIPPLTDLVGVRVHTAFITIDPASPFGIRSISGTETFAITL